MARKSNIHRDLKRREMHAKYKDRRAQLKQQMKNAQDPAERQRLHWQLQQLPRNSSPTRLKNRCQVTGASARLHAQVRAFAHHLPGDGFARPAARRAQVVLVAVAEALARDTCINCKELS